MARRKAKFMDDDDSSGDSSTGGDDPDESFDADDQDEGEFRRPFGRGKKRAREASGEESADGVWGAERSRGAGRGRGGRAKAPDYTKGVPFVSAGGSSTSTTSLDNLASSLPIAAGEVTAEDEEPTPMELDSDVDSDEEGEEEYEEEDEELAAVPGLAEELEPETAPEPAQTPLAFAPRGIGSKAKRGIGARGGGGRIGARAGMGGIGAGASAGLGSAAASGSMGDSPVFASATSASLMPLGGFGAGPGTPSASGADSPMAAAATPRAGLGARAGIGGGGEGGGGIGSAPPPPRQSLADSLRQRLAADAAASSTESTPSGSPEPSSETPRERRSFLPAAKPTSIAPPQKISMKEQQHFAQLASSGSLGLKMLQKMGWTSGTGLGANEQGIVTPIGEGQKLRKRGAGIAAGERSAGSLAEERRRNGEDPDAEPEDKKGKRAPKTATPKVVKDAWQQPKRKEPKIKSEYKTYEQIVAESGAEPEGVGMLVDLAGNALPSGSLSSLPAFGAGSADPTRLPELRHNLSLLTSTISSSLSALAREGKGIEERRTYIDHEESRVRKAVEAQERAVERLEGVMNVVARIKEIESEMMGLLMAAGGDELGPQVLLAPFADDFDELLGRFPEEYEEMRLDEVVVGAIAPIVRRLFQSWDPLSSPLFAVPELKRWRRHFLIDKDVVKTDGMDVDVFGAASHSNGGSSRKASDRAMTAYETMMWTVWLPRVRSAINNAWSPSDPTPAVALFTSWSPLLPLFLRDNILDQLILPKVSKAIVDWSPSSVRRGGASLHTIVFPWLEHAGERMEQVLEESKRKVRAWLKGWKASDGVPKGLDAWKDAFPASDWDTLILKHVLPQLGTTLRETFIVNPRQQDLKPLEDVLAWAPLLRPSMMSQLIEGGFFTKWLDALYLWLTSEPNLEQVAEWYSYWKSYFPDDILSLSGVSRGFRKGLDLMNQAMALGDDVKYRLKRPDTTPKVPSSTSSSHKSRKPKAAPQPVEEVSFRSIVEEMAAASNLVFLATGKADERGHALFRVSQNVDGKSGVTVYLEDDVVYLLEGGEWRPVSVEEMVRKAIR